MLDLPKLSVRLSGGIDPRRSIDLAKVADANGFDTVWFAENAFNRGDPTLNAPITIQQKYACVRHFFKQDFRKTITA